jgi:hypothetical protein
METFMVLTPLPSNCPGTAMIVNVIVGRERVTVSEVAVSFLFFQNFEVAKVIYEKGCIQAGEEWMERNLLSIASGAVGTAFAQVVYIGRTHYFNYEP